MVQLKSPASPAAPETPPSVRDAGSDHEVKVGSRVMLRVMSAGFAFFVSGVSDGSIGTIIPYAIREYDITTTTMSSV